MIEPRVELLKSNSLTPAPVIREKDAGKCLLLMRFAAKKTPDDRQKFRIRDASVFLEPLLRQRPANGHRDVVVEVPAAHIAVVSLRVDALSAVLFQAGQQSAVMFERTHFTWHASKGNRASVGAIATATLLARGTTRRPRGRLGRASAGTRRAARGDL